MIDVAWWQGDEPDSDRADWTSGMKKAADYAHERGLRFGLYWTDNLDMANPAARRQRADRVRRLFREYDADMWRSDCTRGEVIGSSFAATRGSTRWSTRWPKRSPSFQWENCSGGGRIKDYGAMRRAVKIFNSDTYSPLHVRQAFYDSSYAFHPAQLEGHLGSTDGRFRPRRSRRHEVRVSFDVDGRSRMVSRCAQWRQRQRAVDAGREGRGQGLRRHVQDQDSAAGPPGRSVPHPAASRWPHIGTASSTTIRRPGKGVVFLFKPSSEIATQAVTFKGLDATQMYRLTFEDGTHASCVKSAAELMGPGIAADTAR